MADVIAVDHHRRQRHLCALGQVPGIEALDEGRGHVLAEGFHHLHHQLAPAWQLARTCGLLAGLDPGLAGVAAATCVRAHVRCATEAGDTVAGGSGTVALQVDLQGGTDEHVAGIQACGLRERAVGTHRAVGSGEKHIAARGNVFLHAQFRTERMHRLYEARFDRRNQCRVRVQCPVLADLSLQPERFGIGGEQQFDGGGIEADAVIQTIHAVRGVDALDGHHCHQHTDLGNLRRVAGEERLDMVRLRRLHHEVDPVRRNIDAGRLSTISLTGR